MSALIYDIFFKRFGVKSPQYLMSPTMPSLEKFSFPKNSIHHFAVYDNVHNGPASDEYIYKDISKKIFVQHEMNLGDSKGNPKRLSVPLLPYFRDFHIKNKRFRLSEDITVVKDENTLAVVNYGFVSKVYRYTRSYYTEYFKWWNIEKAVWNKVKALAQTSDRHQFIFTNLPKTLPPVTILNAYSNLFNQQFVKTFNTPEYLFLLEVWKWLSEENRASSVIGVMTPEEYNKINIVYQESGKFLLINLGVLDSWRYVKSEEREGQKIKIDAVALQKRFLRMLMTLMESRSVVQAEPEDEIEDTAAVPDNEINPTIAATNPELELANAKVLQQLEKDEDSTDIESVETRLELSNKLLENLDKDLDALEIIESQRVNTIVVDDEDTDKPKNLNVDISHKDKKVDLSFFDKDRSPEKIIEDICGDLADDGLMTAAEYRKYLKNAENYKNIVSPDGVNSLADFVKIDPAVMKIESSATMVDRNTIVDKTMLKSSLLDFDEKYITKVLEKDVVSMGVAIQKAGLIINRYETEDVEDILGKYQIHSIRVSPIEGTASTLRFRLPTVNADGTYESNGIRYRLRKQRGD